MGRDYVIRRLFQFLMVLWGGDAELPAPRHLIQPLYQVDEHRAAARFLYEQFQAMRPDQLGAILATRERQPSPNA